eukprot:10828064-Prorocentrum_lima.AAC.1
MDWECLCGSQEQGRGRWLPRITWLCSDAWQQRRYMERGGDLVSGKALVTDRFQNGFVEWQWNRGKQNGGLDFNDGLSTRAVGLYGLARSCHGTFEIHHHVSTCSLSFCGGSETECWHPIAQALGTCGYWGDKGLAICSGFGHSFESWCAKTCKLSPTPGRLQHMGGSLARHAQHAQRTEGQPLSSRRGCK